MDATGILPYEKVQVVNNNNGERFETYVMEGERGSGTICPNGLQTACRRRNTVIIISTECDYVEHREHKPPWYLWMKGTR